MMNMQIDDGKIAYELKLKSTTASSGYFAAVPLPAPDFEEGLGYLRRHPLDDFMRKYLIAEINGWSLAKIKQYIEEKDNARDHVLLGLICEACLLNPSFSELLPSFSRSQKKEFCTHTSLIYIKSHLLADHALHAGWASYFHANIYRHRPLPPPEKNGLPLLFSHSETEEIAPEKTLKTIHGRMTVLPTQSADPRIPARATAATALERLAALKIVDGEEMRHESSLSPYALLRKWRLDRSIESLGLNYRITGIQTAYGKGIELDSARASYAMEIVERASAYATIKSNVVSGTRRDHRLVYGKKSELKQRGYTVLDPNSLGLETPYKDEPLHWIEAQYGAKRDNAAVWVPVQCVFLFTNLDEIALFSGLGSTGLASGNTLADAKLGALLEILERDCEAVNPFHPARCFRVTADDPKISALLENYRRLGIQILFQDISPAYGVPCCKCFVVFRDGSIAKGTSAHLNGKKAVLSALTETPYPYPYGPPSMPSTIDSPMLRYEDLPDFSFNNAPLDLELLETLLCANGLEPIYVELTRSDLDLPVVKALIPGTEIMNDFDQFARISPRLFSSYLKMHGR